MTGGCNRLEVLLLAWGIAAMDACLLVDNSHVCQGITHSFPDGMTSLVILITNGGEINSTVFQSRSLASVTRLDIRNANITSFTPGAFRAFQNLSVLTLDGNSLTQLDPIWFGRPGALRDLNLAENCLESLSASMFSEFTGLQGLGLSKNSIRTVASGSFDSLTSLVQLDLSGNKLTRLSSEVFLKLDSTSVRLDGNPWDCSCGVEEFVEFLRGLQNKSLLENEAGMTCASPSGLIGAPVWNLSQCLTTPWPETITPTLNTTVPTTAPILVPILVGVIVVLCVLLCFVCALAVLCRRKREAQQVKPRPLTEDEEEAAGEEHPHMLTDFQRKHLEINEMTSWDPELVWRAPLTGLRAKSAHAVLSTSPFSVAMKELLSMESQIEGPSDQLQNADDKSTKDTEIQMEGVDGGLSKNDSPVSNAIPRHEKEDSNEERTTESQQHGDKSISKAFEDTETIPYLTIGTARHIPKPEHGPGQPDCGEDYKGQNSQMGKVSTWPPTSVQWKAQCVDQGFCFFLCSLNKPVVESEVLCLTREENHKEESLLAKMFLQTDPVTPESHLEFNMLPSEDGVGDISDDRVSPGTASLEPDPVNTCPESDTEPDPERTDPESEAVNTEPAEVSVQSLSCLVSVGTAALKSFSRTLDDCLETNDDTAEPQSAQVSTSQSPCSEVHIQHQAQLTKDQLDEGHLDYPLSDLATEGMYLSSEDKTGRHSQFWSEEPNPNETIEPISEEVPTSQCSSTDFKSETQSESPIQSGPPDLDPNPEENTLLESVNSMTQSLANEVQCQTKIENQTHLSKTGDPEYKPEETPPVTDGKTGQNTPLNNSEGASGNEPWRSQENRDGQHGRRGGHPARSGSQVPSGGLTSPGEERLLEHNEYAYIDLLHEVVQNQGRWTRTRWKQTQINKQLYKHQRKGP